MAEILLFIIICIFVPWLGALLFGIWVLLFIVGLFIKD